MHKGDAGRQNLGQAKNIYLIKQTRNKKNKNKHRPKMRPAGFGSDVTGVFYQKVERLRMLSKVKRLQGAAVEACIQTPISQAWPRLTNLHHRKNMPMIAMQARSLSGGVQTSEDDASPLALTQAKGRFDDLGVSLVR